MRSGNRGFNGKLLLLAALMSAAPLAAQDYPRHNISLNVGAASPGADLRDLFNDKAILGVSYGYRFHEYFQADIGLDTVFGAAGVKDYLPTDLGYLRIRDRQYLLPMGGRAILPLAGGRFLFAGGGGAAYMNYRESIRQPSSYYQVSCPSCTARSGWGYYGLVSATAFLDQGRHFRLGATSRVYRGHTEGDPIGVVPALRTRDTWVNIMGEFGFSF